MRSAMKICPRLVPLSSTHFASRSLGIIGLCLVLVASVFDFVDATKLRMCVVESAHTTKKINKLCPKLKSDNGNQVECVIANDRINCLRRLAVRDAEFAVLEPEDLVLAGSNTEYDILVTHELRLFENDTQRFAMVALVAGSINSPSDLMGKSFCHSGYEMTSDDSSRIFDTYFQNWIIPRKCDRDKSLVENEVASLSEFFGRACIPGAWTADSTYDNYLKSKYRNLCALCDNPAGCYNSDKYYGREGALLCMTENAADVAWVRLEDTLRHFKSLELNETKYGYLCPDGTARTMGVGKPCVWIRRPWPVVVAIRSSAERVAKVVDSVNERRFAWQNDVAQLMESYRVTPVTTETLPTPDDFLRRCEGTLEARCDAPLPVQTRQIIAALEPKIWNTVFRQVPGFATANTRAGCSPSRTIRWCIASNLEDRKCRTMKNIAQSYGIWPPISCIQQANRTACLDAVRYGRSDIFVVKPEEEVEATLRGSRPLLRATTNKKQDINVVGALVRNDSHYRTLEDLRGARACFTGYRSIGWNAFVDRMANSSNDPLWNCSDLRAVSNFFEDCCVLGIEKSKLPHSVPSNLYSLCQRGDDDVNATAGAYACLKSGRGDVAFVSLPNGLDGRGGSIKAPNGNNLRSLCVDRHGRSEDSCHLTWSSLATVMTNENTTELRREEIYSTLLDIDRLFGKNFPGPAPAFSLYGPYDSARDIIFPERTQHLQRELGRHWLRRSYADVVERLAIREKTYDYCNGANRRAAMTTYGTIATIFLITIFSASIV